MRHASSIYLAVKIIARPAVAEDERKTIACGLIVGQDHGDCTSVDQYVGYGTSVMSFSVGICVLMDFLCNKNLEEGSGFSYL